VARGGSGARGDRGEVEEIAGEFGRQLGRTTLTGGSRARCQWEERGWAPAG
jgi:hypothetical protein